MSLLLVLFFIFSCINADEIKDTWKSIAHQAKSIWHGAEGLGKGFAQTFGVPLPEYKYSWRVFNDAPVPIVVVEFQIVSFMGTRFKGKITRHQTLPPMQNTGDDFYDRQLYFKIYLFSTNNKENPLETALNTAFGSKKLQKISEEHKIYSETIYPWQPHDKNIYFYRAYNQQGKVKGESLDVKSLSNQFAGQFYNSSTFDVLLQFERDGQTYEITLEQDSFNLLNSSEKDYSIRPPASTKKFFKFFTVNNKKRAQVASIPIATEGIAYVADDHGKKQSKKGELPDAGMPMLYTYEVYGNKAPKVGLQGLSVGNYSQPVNGKVRDINPLQCFVWYKSAQQILHEEAKKSEKIDYTNKPFDQLESVWIVYKTKDNHYTNILLPGTQKSFQIVRPRLSEQKASIYALSVLPDGYNQKSFDIFLSRLIDGKIGQKSLFTSVLNPLDPKDIEQALQGNVHGIINDTEKDASGLTAALLLEDVFYPQGVGSGPFYYMLEPGRLRIDQFVHLIWFDDSWYEKDPMNGALILKQEIMKKLYDKLPEWIVNFRKNKQQAVNELTIFIKEHANKSLFKAGTNEFNEQGQTMLNNLIDGPISLKNYPMLRKSGINYYVFGLGKKPDQWPEEKN